MRGTRSMRRLFWPSLALVPALGLAMAVSPAVGASTTHVRVPVPVDARAAAAARVALQHLTLGHPPNERRIGHTQRVKGLTMQNSYNWSGYADDNTSANVYSKVSGKW